jgi:hypothetical protein
LKSRTPPVTVVAQRPMNVPIHSPAEPSSNVCPLPNAARATSALAVVSVANAIGVPGPLVVFGIDWALSARHSPDTDPPPPDPPPISAQVDPVQIRTSPVSVSRMIISLGGEPGRVELVQRNARPRLPSVSAASSPRSVGTSTSSPCSGYRMSHRSV